MASCDQAWRAVLASSQWLSHEHQNSSSPMAWQMSANDRGDINSNYGHLIEADKYHGQYYQVLDELLRDYNTRRAIMI